MDDTDKVFPCPNCSSMFLDTTDLFTHVTAQHGVEQCTNLVGVSMNKKLSRNDFIQVDSTWLFVVGRFHLSISPNDQGEFMLSIYGSVDPIPPATMYPTEPEWDKALLLANKFLEAYLIAMEKE